MLFSSFEWIRKKRNRLDDIIVDYSKVCSKFEFKEERSDGPSPCLAPLSAPASDVFPARRRDEREAFLPPPPRSQFTEELIPDAERRRGSTKGGGSSSPSSSPQREKRGRFNRVFRLVSALFSASIIGRVVFRRVDLWILIQRRIKY